MGMKVVYEDQELGFVNIDDTQASGIGTYSSGKIETLLENKQDKLAAIDGTVTNSNPVATKSTVNSALVNYMNVPLKNVTLYSTVSTRNNLKYYEIGNMLRVVGSFSAKSLSVWSNAGSLPFTFSDNTYIKDISGNNLLYVKTNGTMQVAKTLTADTEYYIDYSLPIAVTTIST